MPDFTNTLIVGISSRTLFDLEQEDQLFKEKGIVEYRKIQRYIFRSIPTHFRIELFQFQTES